MNINVGIKGCEQQSANLLEKPLYSIVPSGNKHVILDEQKGLLNRGIPVKDKRAFSRITIIRIRRY